MIQSFIKEIKTVLDKNQIQENPQELLKYQGDRYQFVKNTPVLVLYPFSDKDVKAILKLANKFKIHLTIWGAGTSTTGAATVKANGVIISTERMNKIIELDIENQVLVVEPGVVLADLIKFVEENNFFYPPDPASLDLCTIGGNVIQNAGGARALKYGVTANYVLGLEGFWANGEKFKLGGKIFKNAIRYDLISLLIGSEGTLGFITKIYLKLLHKPKFKQNLLVSFANFQQAFKTLQIIKETKIQPTAVEFLDQYSFTASLNYLEENLNYDLKGKAFLIFEFDANYQEELVEQLFLTKKIIKQNFGKELMSHQNNFEKIWQIRRSLSDAFKALAKNKISHDIVVPPNKIHDFMRFLARLDQKYQAKILGFGHLGDGNIHINILEEKKQPFLGWEEERKKLTLKIMKKAIQLGGTISGEHGIGLAKKPYFSLVSNKKEQSYLRRIKKIFDPHNILNQGKIF